MMSIFGNNASVLSQLAREQVRTKGGYRPYEPGIFRHGYAMQRSGEPSPPVPTVTASASVGRLLYVGGVSLQ